MKRNHRDDRKGWLKRLKSSEGDAEEDETNDVPPPDCRTSKEKQRPRKKRLEPGFGFTKQTSHFYLRNRYNKSNVNGIHSKLPRCDEKRVFPGSFTALGPDGFRLSATEPCQDQSLETDTLDLTEDSNKQVDEVDKACPTAKADITKFKAINYDFSKSHPGATRSSVLDYDNDLETDIIIPEAKSEVCLLKPPDAVPESFSDMRAKEINEPFISISCVDIFVKKKKPLQASKLVIPHTEAGQHLLDDFGSRIQTYESRTHDGRKYFRHIFCDVIEGEPADEMRIRDGYEMVLLNDVFVPDLDHNEVLNLFHQVKVDGVTRFKLILRYVTRKRNTWTWLETSAILCPDADHKGSGDRTTVDNEHFRLLPGNETSSQVRLRYRIKGTKYFIVIEDSQVGVSLEPYDVLVDKRYKQDKYGNVTFTASLCSNSKKNYITMVGRHKRIQIGHQPYWFHMVQTGSDFTFQSEDDVFLAYDFTRKVICASDSKCLFEEFSPEFDEVDNACTSHQVLIHADAKPDQIEQEEMNDEHMYEPGALDPIASTNGDNIDNRHAELGKMTSQGGQNVCDADSALVRPKLVKKKSDESNASSDMTSSQSSMGGEFSDSSGYLTSKSFGLSFDEDTTTSFSEGMDSPKTPNTPMESLNINSPRCESWGTPV